MDFHGFDPADPNKWYQSPHLGLVPAGYGGEISGNCSYYSAVGASYQRATHFTHPTSHPPPHHFTQPNHYPPPQHNYYPPPPSNFTHTISYPPPHHFSQSNHYPPPQHSYDAPPNPYSPPLHVAQLNSYPPPQSSHSGTLIHGHWLPLQFPCASQTQAQDYTSPHSPSIPSYYTPHPNLPISPNSSHDPMVVHSHLWRARCKQVALESTAATGGVKKHRRFGLGTVALRYAGKGHKRKELLMRKPQFKCLIGEITQGFKTHLRLHSSGSEQPRTMGKPQGSGNLLSTPKLVPATMVVHTTRGTTSSIVASVKGNVLISSSKTNLNSNHADVNLGFASEVGAESNGVKTSAITPSVLVYNAMDNTLLNKLHRGCNLSGAVSQDDGNRADQHLAVGFVNSILDYSSYENKSCVENADDRFDALRIIENDDSSNKVFYPDIAIWTAVVCRYCKLGRFEKAKKVLIDVIKRWIGFTMITDTGLMNDNIGEEGMFARGNYKRMQVTVKRMLNILLEKWKSKEGRVSTAVNLSSQHVGRAFENFLCDWVKLPILIYSADSEDTGNLVPDDFQVDDLKCASNRIFFEFLITFFECTMEKELPVKYENLMKLHCLAAAQDKLKGVSNMIGENLQLLWLLFNVMSTLPLFFNGVIALGMCTELKCACLSRWTSNQVSIRKKTVSCAITLASSWSYDLLADGTVEIVQHFKNKVKDMLLGYHMEMVKLFKEFVNVMYDSNTEQHVLIQDDFCKEELVNQFFKSVHFDTATRVLYYVIKHGFDSTMIIDYGFVHGYLCVENSFTRDNFVKMHSELVVLEKVWEKICLFTGSAIIHEAHATFILTQLIQVEHEHGKWSAAVFLALISSCLHYTDHKQESEEFARVVEMMCGNQSNLVKGVYEMANENCYYSHEEIWGIAGLVPDLTRVLSAMHRVGAHDAIFRIKVVLKSLPHTNGIIQGSFHHIQWECLHTKGGGSIKYSVILTMTNEVCASHAIIHLESADVTSEEYKQPLLLSVIFQDIDVSTYADVIGDTNIAVLLCNYASTLGMLNTYAAAFDKIMAFQLFNVVSYALGTSLYTLLSLGALLMLLTRVLGALATWFSLSLHMLNDYHTSAYEKNFAGVHEVSVLSWNVDLLAACVKSDEEIQLNVGVHTLENGKDKRNKACIASHTLVLLTVAERHHYLSFGFLIADEKYVEPEKECDDEEGANTEAQGQTTTLLISMRIRLVSWRNHLFCCLLFGLDSSGLICNVSPTVET